MGFLSGLFGGSAPQPQQSMYGPLPSYATPDFATLAMQAIVNGQTPQMTRNQYGAAALQGQIAQAKFQQMQQAFADDNGNSSGGQSGGPPGGTVSGGQNSGDPSSPFPNMTPAQAQKKAMALTFVDPEWGKNFISAYQATQPHYATINGRQYLDNGSPGAVMNQNYMPANTDTTQSVPNASGQGYTSQPVLGPGGLPFSQFQAGQAAIADAAKNNVAPGQPNVTLGIDPLSGLPYKTGVGLVPGQAQSTQDLAAATAKGAAQGDLVAVPQADGTIKYINKAQAAASGTGPAPITGGAPFGAEDTMKAAQKNYEAIQADSLDAQNTLANNAKTRQLLSAMNTGKYAAQGNDLAAMAQSIGLPGNYQGLNNSQVLASVNANQMGALRKAMGMTRLTDTDTKIINGAITNNNNTLQGNLQLLDNSDALANRRVLRGTFASNYKNANKSLANPSYNSKGQQLSPDFETGYINYQTKNPVFGGK